MNQTVIGSISSLKLECIEIEKYNTSNETGIIQIVYNKKPFGLYIETGHPMLPVSFEVSDEKVLIDFFNEFKKHELNIKNSLFYIDEENCIYFDTEYFAKYNSNNISYDDEETLGFFFQHITSHLDK